MQQNHPNPNNLIIKHELERIKEERREMNRQREKRKLEYKKIQVMMKNKQIDSKLKEYKDTLDKNQQIVRNIDNIKHAYQFDPNVK